MSTKVNYFNDGKGKDQSHEVQMDFGIGTMVSYGNNPQEALSDLLNNMKKFKKFVDESIAALESGDIDFIGFGDKLVDEFYTTNYYTGDTTPYTKEEILQKFNGLIKSNNGYDFIGKSVRIIVSDVRAITGSVESYNSVTNKVDVRVGSYVPISGPEPKNGIILTVPVENIELI